jgi:hypothetical protein
MSEEVVGDVLSSIDVNESTYVDTLTSMVQQCEDEVSVSIPIISDITETGIAETTDVVETTKAFKTRRQTNRDIINAKLRKKLKVLTRKLHQIKKCSKIIESGHTEFMSMESNTLIVVKIYTKLKLKKSMKILISATSEEAVSSNLMYYLRSPKDDDEFLYVVAKNDNNIRSISFTYIIVE